MMLSNGCIDYFPVASNLHGLLVLQLQHVVFQHITAEALCVSHTEVHQGVMQPVYVLQVLPHPSRDQCKRHDLKQLCSCKCGHRQT
eukprot:1199421-Amphidinium_carterae.1